jgi:hypothetical protein
MDPSDLKPATSGRSALGMLRDGRGEAIVYAWPIKAGTVLLVTWTKSGEMSARIEHWGR